MQWRCSEVGEWSAKTENYAGFCRYIALTFIEQEILGNVSSGNEVRGALDREIGKMGADPKCAPRQRSQSDSKNASRVSFAWKRRNGMPTGRTFANALSFMARSACKYAFVVSMLSCPSHSAMTAMSTPD